MAVSGHVSAGIEPKSRKHSQMLSPWHAHFNMRLCLQTLNTVPFSLEEHFLQEIHRSTCFPCSQLEEFPVGGGGKSYLGVCVMGLQTPGAWLCIFCDQLCDRPSQAPARRQKAHPHLQALTECRALASPDLL